MKIGILTFHSQLNYGGVLQCWALSQFLRGQGHEVVVLDHWMFRDNFLLWEWLLHLTKRKLVRHLLLFLTCRGYAGRTLRILRTVRFIRRIGLTPYHFNRWSEAPKDLGVDCIVVGSDQVWHWGDGVFPDPAPYLLDDAPQIPAISYAASFGMNALPPGTLPIYAEAFRRFTAISVREMLWALLPPQGRKLPMFLILLCCWTESTGKSSLVVGRNAILLFAILHALLMSSSMPTSLICGQKRTIVVWSSWFQGCNTVIRWQMGTQARRGGFASL